jgi:predicted transcriptional regulator
MSHSSLAGQADVEVTHILMLEKDSADPKSSTIFKLVNALSFSSDTLFGG